MGFWGLTSYDYHFIMSHNVQEIIMAIESLVSNYSVLMESLRLLLLS